MADIVTVLVSLIANGDGMDDDTGCIAWTNLGNGTQFSHGIFQGPIGDVGRQVVNMNIDQVFSRTIIEGGFQLRFKWNPMGHDTFVGFAEVQLEYAGPDADVPNAAAAHRYYFSNIEMTQDQEWYFISFSGAGGDGPPNP